MITGIGAVGAARTVDVQGNAGARTIDTPAAAGTTGEAETPVSPAATLAAQGAPIDTDKVSALKAAIANGTYKVDARAIAGRMIALDLPAQA